MRFLKQKPSTKSQRRLLRIRFPGKGKVLWRTIISEIEYIPTRNGLGEGLVLAGEESKNVVVLCADLTESTRMELFKEKFPNRFIQMGVAEQNLATVAAGLGVSGKIPFIASYATFS